MGVLHIGSSIANDSSYRLRWAATSAEGGAPFSYAQVA